MESRHAWWNNVATEYDDEMARIDGIIGDVDGLGEQALRLRTLIGTLDLCQHRSAHRVECIIEVIGAVDPSTGTVGSTTPVGCDGRARRQVLAQVCELWVKQTPLAEAQALQPEYADDVAEIYERLGEFSPLKAWQVERLQLKIADYGFSDVVQSFAEGGAPADTAEGPCRWELENRLIEAFTAIGGGAGVAHDDGQCRLRYGQVREQMLEIAAALDAFAWQQPAGAGWVHAALGVYSPLKAWLAASLARTIRSQLS